MWDRTITVGSAGKTFSVTGWRLGWSIGPKHLIHCLCMAHQNCNYTCPTPLQVILAFVFRQVMTLSLPCVLCMLDYKADPFLGQIGPLRGKVQRIFSELLG